MKSLILLTAILSGFTASHGQCPDFSLRTVVDQSRIAAYKGGTRPRILRVVAKHRVLAEVKIPTDSDANGFSLIKAAKLNTGFFIEIEYGIRFHHQKRFIFRCVQNTFQLVKISDVTYDSSSEAGRNAPRISSKKVVPPIPITRFSLFDHL
jgi:hypothetical protein